MSGYPTFTSIPRVDGLSTDPREMGCHTNFANLYSKTNSRISAINILDIIFSNM